MPRRITVFGQDVYRVEMGIIGAELGRTSSLVSRLTDNRANGTGAGNRGAFNDLYQEVVAR